MAGEPADRARDKGRSGLPEVIGTGFLLSALGAHSAMNFGRKLAALDLTPPHVGLLRAIGLTPGQSQQAIADQFGMPPSRMVAFIDDLEHVGMVERRRDPRDRRAHNLFLTDKGATAMTRIAEIGREWEEELVKSLSRDERVQLRALLERLVADQGITPGVHPGYRTMKPETPGDLDVKGG